MKKNDVQIGATYLVKVAGNLVPVKIDREHDNGGWLGVSVKTGKTIRIKSPQRLRKRLADAAPTGKRIMSKAQYEAEAKREADTAGTNGKMSGGGITEANKADAVNAAMLAVEADKKKRAKKAAKATKDAKPMSLLDAAAHLLSLGTGDPMRCQDIVDLAVNRNLWTPGKGKTPASTLYAAIHREIKAKGDASRFVKAERGKFALASKKGA